MSRVLRIPRSTIYARRHAAIVPKPTPAKRGPKPAISDDALLEAIREDLKNSPFKGEGHRKVWARLKFGQGMQVSRKRVLGYQSLRNLMALVLMAMFFGMVHLGSETKLSVLCHHAIQAGKRLFGVPDFRYYTIADGIREIFGRCQTVPFLLLRRNAPNPRNSTCLISLKLSPEKCGQSCFRVIDTFRPTAVF